MEYFKIVLNNWDAVLTAVSIIVAGISFLGYLKKTWEAAGWEGVGKVLIQEIEKHKRETGNQVIPRAIAKIGNEKLNDLVAKVTKKV